jgi:carboxybiotin decarboxylase
MKDAFQFVFHGIEQFSTYTAFANMTWGHLVMIIIGLVFIYLAITKEYEPMLLIPIGFGMVIGNVAFLQGAGLQIGIYEEGSVLNYLYFGVIKGIYPPLIFLGIGAMTDFSTLAVEPTSDTYWCSCPDRNFRRLYISACIRFPCNRGSIDCNYWRC